MSETTTATEVPESERRLVRPADDRVIAGVSSGLARYFDMNPLIYRVAFAALILFGGAGLVLYAAAWLVIPDERREESLVGEAIRDHRSRPWLVIGVGLVSLGLLLGIAESGFWPDAGDVWLAALAVGLAIVWWQVREEQPGVWEPREPSPGGATPTGDAAEAGDTTTMEARPGGAPPPSRRRRFPIFLPTLGIVIAAVGVLGILELTDVVDVDWTLALAGGVVLIGLAVAVGAFFGATGALAALGVALAALMIVAVTLDLPLRGPIGEVTERPATASELEREYEVSIGRLELDLRDVDLPRGATRVDASVGVGELVVQVPSDTRVVVNAEVGAGGSHVFGQQEDGWDVSQTRVFEGPAVGDSTLILDTEVGVGDLEVHAG